MNFVGTLSVDKLIVAGTGHRPQKLWPKDPWNTENQKTLADTLTLILQQSRIPIDRIISGMAQGFDQSLAMAAVSLGIPFTAAVPFKGQETAWPDKAQQRYRTLISFADTVVIVSEGGYTPWKMQKRNEYMVDNCTLLMAIWNGTPGGTANCIQYAKTKNIPIRYVSKELV